MTAARVARLRAKNAAFDRLSKADAALRRAQKGTKRQNGLTTAQVRERERLAQEYRVALAAVEGVRSGGKQWQRKAV